MKGTVLDGFQAVRQLGRTKFTVGESGFTDTFHRVGNDYRFKAAMGKCPVVDFRQIGWNVDT